MWYNSLTGPDKVLNIYFADSIDRIDWNIHGVVLDIGDAGSWESTGVFRPAVLYDGAIYKMWYEGRDSGTPGIHRFGYATSPDGIHWTKYGANPVLVPGGNGGWDDCNIAGKAVLFNGTHYLMWYGVEAYIDSPFKIGVATSADGIVWTKYSGNPVLVPESSGWDNHWLFPGAVLLNGGLYEMWYSGIGQPPPAYGIGLATSPDGFSWSKCTGNPVLSTGSPGSWDSWSIEFACVIRKGHNLLMFYDGQQGGEPQDLGRIGLATSYIPYIFAEVSFSPNTLNLKGKGKSVTGYIELPNGYDAAGTDVSTILLNGTVPAELSPTAIGDYDGDGIPDLMVKFNRIAVSQFILAQNIKFGNVTLTLTGKLFDGTMFEGSDLIHVKMPGDVNGDLHVCIDDVLLAIRAFGTRPGDAKWNPYADENGDAKIGIDDLLAIILNFGKTYN
jgi:predicted GH43/DUF377 family glycosyl hydrolase